MDITNTIHKLLNTALYTKKDTENNPFFYKISQEIQNYEKEYSFTQENNKLMKLSIKYNTFANETKQILQQIKPPVTQSDFFEGLKYILLKRMNNLSLQFETSRLKYYKNLPSINLEELENISVKESKFSKQTKTIYKKFVKKAHEFQKINQQLNDICKIQKLINSALLEQRGSVYEIIERKENIKKNIDSTSLEIQKGKEERSFLMRILTVHIYCSCFVLLFVNFY